MAAAVARTGESLPSVTWRGRRIDAGNPAVAASIQGGTLQELLEDARRLRQADADVAEWRADGALSRGAEPAELLRWVPDLRAALGGVPLLLTLRTVAEGGAFDVSDAGYVALLGELIEAEGIDAVDVELEREGALTALGPLAERRGVDVVASWHDVTGTPSAAELVTRLERMADAGVQVAKIAATAHTRRDVLAVLEAAVTAAERLTIPVIVIAMGRLGVVTRLRGHDFGSVLTFGALARASAPGQLPVAELRRIVELAGVDHAAPGRPG